MTRDEFLKELRMALQGQVSQAQVNEQLRYYENYIVEESRKGKTEEEVILSLGNPRLIAKTIIGVSGDEFAWQAQEKETKKEKQKPFYFKRGRKHSWFGRALATMILIALVIVLVRIGILLLPILISACVTGIIVYLLFFIFLGNKK